MAETMSCSSLSSSIIDACILMHIIESTLVTIADNLLSSYTSIHVLYQVTLVCTDFMVSEQREGSRNVLQPLPI
jgi:hypothetical protein